jgi:hypothetical protein
MKIHSLLSPHISFNWHSYESRDRSRERKKASSFIYTMLIIWWKKYLTLSLSISNNPLFIVVKNTQDNHFEKVSFILAQFWRFQTMLS